MLAQGILLFQPIGEEQRAVEEFALAAVESCVADQWCGLGGWQVDDTGGLREWVVGSG